MVAVNEFAEQRLEHKHGRAKPMGSVSTTYPRERERDAASRTLRVGMLEEPMARVDACYGGVSTRRDPPQLGL